MAVHLGYQKTPVTLSGVLEQMFDRPNSDCAIALVSMGDEQSTAMKMSRSAFQQLSEAKWLNKPVSCRCDGDGTWSIEADRRPN